MIFFHIRDKEGNTIACNKNQDLITADFIEINKIIILGGRVKGGLFDFGNKTIEFITKDPDLLRSNKLFKKGLIIAKTLSISFFEYYLNAVKRHSHTLKTIQGQMKQKAESIVHDIKSLSHNEYKKEVASRIKNDPDLAADVICYLNKRIDDINAHIESFEILSLGREKEIEINSHNIKKVLLRIVQPFYDDFNQIGVSVGFEINDDFAENNKVDFDYKTFNLAIYNLFDNSVKYIKPYSAMKILLENQNEKYILKMNMLSLRIERDEQEKIFDEGYSGINANELAGVGMGMYITRRALKLNNIKISVVADYSKSEIYNSKQYIYNNFIIEIPK